MRKVKDYRANEKEARDFKAKTETVGELADLIAEIGDKTGGFLDGFDKVSKTIDDTLEKQFGEY